MRNDHRDRPAESVKFVSVDGVDFDDVVLMWTISSYASEISSCVSYLTTLPTSEVTR